MGLIPVFFWLVVIFITESPRLLDRRGYEGYRLGDWSQSWLFVRDELGTNEVGVIGLPEPVYERAGDGSYERGWQDVELYGKLQVRMI
jgi:hypothetical protein